MIELLVFTLAITILWYYLGRRDENFPPGPTGLSLLGSLLMLRSRIDKTLRHLKKTSGPILGVRLGIYRVVLLNDAKLIREAFNMNVFSGRSKLNFSTTRNDDGIVRGILNTDGPHWREQRRFTLKNLRDFGFGTKTMEAKIQEEIDELMASFQANGGVPMEGKALFYRSVLSSLWSIMFGSRLDKDNPDLLEAFEGLTIFLSESNILRNAAIFFPWIAKIAPKLSGFEEMLQGFSCIKNFMRNQIKHHNVHYIENQPRDFVDAYTDEMNHSEDRNSSFHTMKDFMPETLSDLFIAGTDTTGSTLSWLLAYLLHHPEIQKKLQDEIDEVVGNQRRPLLADRPFMPYTEAVIHEVLRLSNVLPIGIVHSASDDVQFHGFLIPKDTIVIPNLYGVHYDEEIWGDPENFRPERFIDEKGFKKNENLLNFSTGKRICLGQGPARDQLFLFTTNVFQNFSLSAAGKLPSLEPHVGLTFSPQPFQVILKKRVEGVPILSK